MDHLYTYFAVHIFFKYETSPNYRSLCKPISCIHTSMQWNFEERLYHKISYLSLAFFLASSTRQSYQNWWWNSKCGGVRGKMKIIGKLNSSYYYVLYAIDRNRRCVWMRMAGTKKERNEISLFPRAMDFTTYFKRERGKATSEKYYYNVYTTLNSLPTRNKKSKSAINLVACENWQRSESER